ncbi:MAG: threonylcarbamoyl-AMP synthase [Planctomycetes bacterium]|nr:threonylcarbamoyl-AMP synthase [Planctomycetota bacterium]
MITPADEASIARAAEALQQGDVVAMPTETVYGLAADALNAEAVAKVFAIKQRPSFDPLIVHVASLEMAEAVACFNDTARRLAQAFWPGPLTMVLPKQPCVPDIVTSGLNSVGVRMPNHASALALIRTANTPLAAPSANLFGRVSPTSAQHVADQLGDKVEVILDGGPCQIGLESCVVEVEGDGVKVLRLGAITMEDIAKLGIPATRGLAVHERPNAPGMLASHYAPRKTLRLVERVLPESANPRLGALVFQDAPTGFGHVEVLSPSGNLIEAAANLFAAMRRLESANIDEILAEVLPEDGIGAAIMDRLRRAAGEV